MTSWLSYSISVGLQKFQLRNFFLEVCRLLRRTSASTRYFRVTLPGETSTPRETRPSATETFETLRPYLLRNLSATSNVVDSHVEERPFQGRVESPH